jgi:predicted permease
MDAYVIGFLLGVFMAGLSAVGLWAGLGLIVSVLRRLKNKESGMMIVVYSVETIISISVVIALGGLASRVSFDATSYWLGVSLTIVGNGFIFVAAVGKMWNALKSELAAWQDRPRSKN